MRALALVIIGSILPSAASAQCPGWSGDFGLAGEGITGRVASLATFDDGHGPALYAAGRFTNAGSSGAVDIARWNGAHWSALNPAPQFSSGLDSILSLAVIQESSGPAMYACGDFQMTGVARTTLHDVARFDGTTWTQATFGTWADTATSYTDGSGAGPRLCVYTNMGINGNVVTFAGSGGDFFDGSPILSMASADLGNGPRLYAGQMVGTIRIYDGASFLGTIQPPYYPQRVEKLLAWDDGNGMALYAAGLGTTASGTKGYVARYDGTNWTELGLATSTTSPALDVYGLGVHDFGNGPRLVAAGSFDAMDGVPATGIAMLENGSWSALGTGIGAITGYTLTDIASLDEHDGSGPALFVSSGFTQAGGVPSMSIARYDSCGGPVSLFCFGDGSATACPCGNASAIGARAGCLNSLGTGGTLRVSGQASLAHDTLVLQGGGMPSSSALYFQAGNVAVGGVGFTFGDGVKCTAGPFVRLRTKANVNGASSYPSAGDASLSVKGMITSPGTRHYQVHYRNAGSFCTSATFNLTNAATVQWAP